VLAAVGIAPGMEVIDLCSGDGWFTLKIAKIAAHVTAIDIDPNLLEIARHRLTEAGVNNCDFVAGDAYALDKLVSGPTDFVFLANAFHGAPDRSRLARAVRATLKPGGRLSIVNWHQRPREETTILGEPRGPKTELRCIGCLIVLMLRECRLDKERHQQSRDSILHVSASSRVDVRCLHVR
jgi:ubiquinone/menaquinone biosynthesis C-methylase UbiE